MNNENKAKRPFFHSYIQYSPFISDHLLYRLAGHNFFIHIHKSFQPLNLCLRFYMQVRQYGKNYFSTCLATLQNCKLKHIAVHLTNLSWFNLQHCLLRESTKHGLLVHRSPPWTGSMITPFHGPVPWTPYHGPGPWTPSFYYP